MPRALPRRLAADRFRRWTAVRRPRSMCVLAGSECAHGATRRAILTPLGRTPVERSHWPATGLLRHGPQNASGVAPLLPPSPEIPEPLLPPVSRVPGTLGAGPRVPGDREARADRVRSSLAGQDAFTGSDTWHPGRLRGDPRRRRSSPGLRAHRTTCFVFKSIAGARVE